LGSIRGVTFVTKNLRKFDKLIKNIKECIWINHFLRYCQNLKKNFMCLKINIFLKCAFTLLKILICWLLIFFLISISFFNSLVYNNLKKFKYLFNL
jgi:hypothetical protein